MRIRAIRASVGAIVAAATLGLAAPGMTATRTKIPVEDGPARAGKNVQVKPYEIVWTGDGTGVFAGHGVAGRRPKFGRLHWSKWTATEGRASGSNWLNDCIPFCAAGRFTPFPVNLTVYRPRVLLGFKVFTRIKVTYTARVPHGYKRTGTFTLAVMRKTFLWNFPV